MTVTEHIREHALVMAGVADASAVPGLDELRVEEWNPEFAERVQNRMVMGRFRYGSIRQRDRAFSGGRARAISRCATDYLLTGNLEALADVAALAMAEYSRSAHPLKHWATTDDTNHWNEAADNEWQTQKRRGQHGITGDAIGSRSMDESRTAARTADRLPAKGRGRVGGACR